MAIRLFTDDPIKKAIAGKDRERGDELGFKLYAQRIAKAILDLKGPFTIGIFGEWGSGKTSLMNLVRDELETKNNILTVGFNAWQYEKDEHPLLPLIGKLRIKIKKSHQFLEEKNNGHKKNLIRYFFPNTKDRRQKLLRCLEKIGSGLTITSGGTLPGTPKISYSFANLFASNRIVNQALDNSVYGNALSELGELEFGENKVVVFLDDLDRCLPENALKLLESIKHILGQKGFIFIIGLYEDGINGYLDKKLGKDYGMSEEDLKHYLHKIIQLEFPVPANDEKILNYTNALISQVDLEKEKKYLEKFSGLINEVCNNNPRSIARLLNSVLVHWDITQEKFKNTQTKFKNLQKNSKDIPKELKDDLKGLDDILKRFKDTPELPELISKFEDTSKRIKGALKNLKEILETLEKVEGIPKEVPISNFVLTNMLYIRSPIAYAYLVKDESIRLEVAKMDISQFAKAATPKDRVDNDSGFSEKPGKNSNEKESSKEKPEESRHIDKDSQRDKKGSRTVTMAKGSWEKSAKNLIENELTRRRNIDEEKRKADDPNSLSREEHIHKVANQLMKDELLKKIFMSNMRYNDPKKMFQRPIIRKTEIAKYVESWLKDKVYFNNSTMLLPARIIIGHIPPPNLQFDTSDQPPPSEQTDTSEKLYPIEISLDTEDPMSQLKKKKELQKMKLLHCSWRAERYDGKFGYKMYRFDALIDGPHYILDQIELVTYHLHPSFGDRTTQWRGADERENHFRIKELQWAEFNLRAEVTIMGEDQPIILDRRITKGTPGREFLEGFK